MKTWRAGFLGLVIVSQVALLTPTNSEDVEALLQKLRRGIEENEGKLQNLRVEGGCQRATWNEQAQKWDYSGEESVTAWYLPAATGKVRIDTHEFVAPLEDGAEPFVVETFTRAYDGYINQTLFTKRGSPLSQVFSPVGELSAKRFLGFVNNPSTGWGYSIYGAGELIGAPTLSILYTWLGKLLATETNFNGASCIKLQWRIKTQSMTWYFDPSRNYALIGGERVKDGLIRESWTAERLLEPEPGIYYPVAVKSFSLYSASGQPKYRCQFGATDVIVNDPNFSNDIFTIRWPKGTLVRDKILGMTYTVGQSAPDVEKAIDAQVKRLKAAVAHPLSPQPKISGGYWIPIKWFTGIISAAVVLTLAVVFTLKRQRT
jgi:hypothetical protein